MATSRRTYRRAIPAREVVSVLEEWNGGNFPWTFAELEALTTRAGYRYQIVSTSLCPSARTFHDTRTIWLTGRDEPYRWLELVHELSEVLLRLPVAPEYHHPLTGEDEKHEVAKLIEKRAALLRAQKRRTAQSEIESIEERRQALERQLRILQEQIAAEEAQLKEAETLLAEL